VTLLSVLGDSETLVGQEELFTGCLDMALPEVRSKRDLGVCPFGDYTTRGCGGWAGFSRVSRPVWRVSRSEEERLEVGFFGFFTLEFSADFHSIQEHDVAAVVTGEPDQPITGYGRL
jgi:hypothetical protein